MEPRLPFRKLGNSSNIHESNVSNNKIYIYICIIKIHICICTLIR